MDDDDELLEPERPALPRAARIAALVLIVAALAALFAIRLWPDSAPKSHQAALGTPPPPPLGTHFPEPTDTPLPAWPTARNACDGTTDLAIAHTRRPAGPTGLRLMLGGSALRIVNFDTGRISPLPTLGSGTFVATLGGSPPTYATTIKCGVVGTSLILRVGTDRSEQPLGKLRSDQSVLADGDHAWIETSPNGGTHSFIEPLGGGPRVRLPANTYVAGIENGTMVGGRDTSRSGSDAGQDLLLIDPDTGRTTRTVAGISAEVGIGSGRVLWTAGCDLDRDAPCRLGVLRLDDGTQRHYRLPRPAFAGTVSPDGSEVALVLERPVADQRYTGHPFPPSEIAVLNLLTGDLYRVPGLLIPPKASPGLAFSAGGRWLAIALDAGTKTRLLAWQPGLGRPYEIAPISGGNYGSPPLVLMPDGTR